MPTDSHLSTILFFSLGLLFVQICFVFYLITQRSKFIEYFILQCEHAKKIEDIEFQNRCQTISINAKQNIIEENVNQVDYAMKYFIGFISSY